MKLAVFSDNFYPEHSGIADSIATIVPALAARGHIIQCFGPKYSPEDYKKVGRPLAEPDWGKTVTFHRFPAFSVSSPSGQGRVVVPRGSGYFALRAFRPDIVHAHQPYGTGLEGLIAARMLGAPLVGTEHTPIREFASRYGMFRGALKGILWERYDAWFYNRCDFVSSPTQAIFDSWKGFNQAIPHRPVPNPIDATEFVPPKKRPAKGFILLYAGRFAREKNLDHILHAAAKVAPKIPGFVLRLVGQGPVLGEMKALAARLGIERFVEFKGFVPERELPRVYRAAHAFVIVSSAETQSIVAMQAMLSSLPVIAVPMWGLKEYIKRSTGIFVPVGDIDALANAVMRLHKNPALRERLGNAGRKSALAYHTPFIAALWETIYKEVRTSHVSRARK